ncbi:hypothetical protein AB205_0085860 [Aquarana catesbeiana]|uniref:Uncharacterized protein n=1 Tax=Aquarana catesbeiana TaxID=8400 RepID=A0A2G9RA67_AQUCT|nr:hypothetical protein AB205_0085860 [Aquarana catesbeiana]
MPNLGLGPWGVLHSNPMDYAWGANGLDTIITQLLNQFENTGPPPADNEKIQALPTIKITQEHVGEYLKWLLLGPFAVKYRYLWAFNCADMNNY